MFGFFKKKKKAQPVTMTTVLCIPGNWKDRTALITAVVKANEGEFLMVGGVLMHIPSQQGFRVEIEGQDHQLELSFRVAGSWGELEEAFYEAINNHQQVVYVSGDTGSLEGAKALAEAAQALLKAGGLGVKVETAGKAFTKTQWETQLADFQEANLCHMFVMTPITDEQGSCFSCGMHNLGCKDTLLEVGGESPEEVLELLDIFSYYQLLEQPSIQDGQTFGIAMGAPVYRIKNLSQQPYEGEELFENPYGMWKLKKIT